MDQCYVYVWRRIVSGTPPKFLVYADVSSCPPFIFLYTFPSPQINTSAPGPNTIPLIQIRNQNIFPNNNRINI